MVTRWSQVRSLPAAPSPAIGEVLVIRIRDFRMNDYDTVLQLWKVAGLIIRPGDEREGIELKLQRDPDLFLIAEDGDEILGVVIGAWDGRRGWINHLAIRPDQQRKGIGMLLIRELEKRLTRKGARKVNAQIYRSNAGSLSFFKAIGYEVHNDLIMMGKIVKK
jgi:ribosomal protein S18 acetylase RimI-like enzyme